VVAILLTGMSGVGKSTVLAELADRGYETVDTDHGDWIHLVGGEPLWREPLMDALLSNPRTGPLFVLGTVANQARFYDRFAAIVLLTAPIEVMFDRLEARPGNRYGKSQAEKAKILRDTAEVLPLLRSRATHELDTTRPAAAVADTLIEIAINSHYNEVEG
jgi:shikimate kinase